MIYVNPASRLGTEFGHLSGVGESKHHDAGCRDAADSPQGAGLLIECGHTLALRKLGMEHERD